MVMTSLLLAAALLAATIPAAAMAGHDGILLTIVPAAIGQQLVRVSMPLPRGFLHAGRALEASNGRRKTIAAARVLTWHRDTSGEPRSARRAMVTFSYLFSDRQPVRFLLRPGPAPPESPRDFPAHITVDGSGVIVAYRNGPTLMARLISPARSASNEPQLETVAAHLRQCWRLPDPQWPRIVEVRADALGGVVVVAHLQRSLPGDGRAPDLGWEFDIRSSRADLLFRFVEDGKTHAIRDPARDYTHGRPDFGGSAPEGIVYFPEVLAFYLRHRPASRLTALPRPDKPLGQVLARVPARTNP